MSMLRVADLKLKGKLALVLVLPLTALLAFSVYLLQREYSAYQALAWQAEGGRLYSSVTNLVHELQRERGLSSGYLTSRGEQFLNELQRQRTTTDGSWSPLLRQARSEGVYELSLLQAFHRNMEKLRNGIDGGGLSGDEAVRGYSGIIHELVDGLNKLTARSDDAQLTRLLIAQRRLVEAKEAAGMERAGGMRLLVQGDGAARVLEKLQRQATEQQVLIGDFHNLTPLAIQQLFNERMSSACVDRLDGFRHGMTKTDGDRLPAAAEWFEVSSCYIDQLREVELYLAGHIERYIQERLSEGRQRLAVILTVTLLPVLPSLLLIVLVARNVNSVSRWLLNAMQGIAGGNFNVSLPPHGRDELGQLADGLNQLRLRLARLVEQKQEILEKERTEHLALTRRSHEIQLFTQRLAGGDLRGELDEKEPTLQELCRSMNQMVQGLRALTERVQASTAPLAAMTVQVHNAINSQSAGASQQAASVNETVSTLEQMRVSSTQTLDKASALGELATRAHSEGERGRLAVEENIRGMLEVQAKVDSIAQTILSLNQWTQRIGEITTAVNDIARQLRLVSLNAAVEATKAGAAGQGFAVVAAEVKQLADQSHTATEQVQHILEEIGHATERAVMATEEGHKGVAHGMGKMERTGEVIRSLVRVIDETSTASRQIIAAVRQESTGIDQIATAMHEIHTVTSGFVEATGHTRNAVQTLSNITTQLDGVVRQYKI